MDGNSGESFLVTGNASDSSWTVRYTLITTGTDITSQVTGAGWTTPVLGPGVTTGICVQLTPSVNLATGASKTLLVTGASLDNPVKRDTVLIKTTMFAQ